MNVIGYVRVSTEEQADSGLGLEAQSKAIRDFSDRRYGKAVSAQYADEGLSGGKSLELDPEKRPGLMGAIRELSEGDVLLVYRLDRLARDIVFVTALEDLVTKRGARIVSTQGEGSDDDTPSGWLTRKVTQLFSEFERRLIQERTKLALAAKRQRGEKAGTVPYGWSDTSGSLKKNKTEQSVVYAIRLWRERKWSYGAIATELNKRGVKAKSGGKWHASSVRSVLLTSDKQAKRQGG